jgi:hypothetical protein
MAVPPSVKAIALLAVLATIATLVAYFTYLRLRRTQALLKKAQAAAEEAARAAALAAPGGIDPEIVLAILNQGLPPTLDNVYMLTQQRKTAEQAQAVAAGERR